MSNKLLLISIVILLIFNAVFLGYLGYHYLYLSFPNYFQPDKVNTLSPYAPQLPGDAEYLLNPPKNMSSDEKTRYMARIRALAKSTNTINITRCDPRPFVTHVDPTQPLTFTNAYDEQLSIHFQIDKKLQTYTLKPKNKTVINPSFPDTARVYRYFCNNALKPTGILFVNKKQ